MMNIGVKRGDIRIPHEEFACWHADRRGQFIEHRQKPGRAVSAPGGHDNLDVGEPCPARESFQPELVAAGIREVAGKRVRMDVTGEVVRPQQFDAAHEVVAGNSAGRCEDGDAGVHGWTHHTLE